MAVVYKSMVKKAADATENDAADDDDGDGEHDKRIVYHMLIDLAHYVALLSLLYHNN